MTSSSKLDPIPEPKTLTKAESMKLVHHLLVMSLGCIAYLRDFFAEDNFVVRRLIPERLLEHETNLYTSSKSGLKVTTLVKGISKEADKFLDWLDHGVLCCLKSGFLKGLSLGIFTDPQRPEKLVECYVFSFAYDENGYAGIRVGSDAEDRVAPVSTVLEARDTFQQLMRRFIILTQSLDSLPSKKYLSMRLIYSDSCPSDFQPHLFRDCTFDTPATVTLPESVLQRQRDAQTDPSCVAQGVGSLSTPHHSVSVSVLSLPKLHSHQGNFETFREINPFEYTTNESPRVANSSTTPEAVADSKSGTFRSLKSQTSANQVSQVSRELRTHLGTRMVRGKLSLSSTRESQMETQIRETQTQVKQSLEVDCECRSKEINEGFSRLICCSSCQKHVHLVCYNIQRNMRYDKICSLERTFVCYSCLARNQYHHPQFPEHVFTVLNLRKTLAIFGSTLLLPKSMSEFSSTLALTPEDDFDESRISRFEISILNMLLHLEMLILGNEIPPEQQMRSTYFQLDKGALMFWSGHSKTVVYGKNESFPMVYKTYLYKQRELRKQILSDTLIFHPDASFFEMWGVLSSDESTDTSSIPVRPIAKNVHQEHYSDAFEHLTQNALPLPTMDGTSFHDTYLTDQETDTPVSDPIECSMMSANGTTATEISYEFQRGTQPIVSRNKHGRENGPVIIVVSDDSDEEGYGYSEDIRRQTRAMKKARNSQLY